MSSLPIYIVMGNEKQMWYTWYIAFEGTKELKRGITSLVGIHEQPPVSFGNCFDALYDSHDVFDGHRVANMSAENFDALGISKMNIVVYNQTFHTEDGMSEDRWIFIDDPMIKQEYYNDDLCFTGRSSPCHQILTDMHRRTRERIIRALS